jgi:hypothetical protein
MRRLGLFAVLTLAYAGPVEGADFWSIEIQNCVPRVGGGLILLLAGA